MARPVLFLGISVAAWEIAGEIEFAARCDAPVLLTGERGIGKTVAGRSIHARSNRSNLPLVAIDCSKCHRPALESELARLVPDRGTLLLKEPWAMSARAQLALLRFFETRDVQALSTDYPRRRVDTRIVSVTRRPLFEAVARKGFLPDLYYRLNLLHIEIPPLRARREDVPAFVDRFLDRDRAGGDAFARTISDDALQLLMAYSWPGNVGELKSVTASLAQSRGGGRIDVDSLPHHIVEEVRSPARPVHEDLFARLLEGDATFWPCVYEPFMARDLSRRTLSELVRLGVEHAGGDYRALARALQVPGHDYGRFLSFLRKYQCLYPFTRLQPVRATLQSRSRRRGRSA